MTMLGQKPEAFGQGNSSDSERGPLIADDTEQPRGGDRGRRPWKVVIVVCAVMCSASACVASLAGKPFFQATSSAPGMQAAYAAFGTDDEEIHATMLGYSRHADGQRCVGGELKAAQASAADFDMLRLDPLLEGRDACESACTVDSSCRFYMWKDNVRDVQQRVECALYSECESRHEHEAAVVYRKQAPANYEKRDYKCGGQLLWDFYGSEAKGLLTNRAVCEAACTAIPQCAGYAWLEGTQRACGAYSSCVATAAASAGGLQSFRKLTANQAVSGAIDNWTSGMYYTTFAVNRYCEGSTLQSEMGDTAVGLLSHRWVCESACSSDPTCKYYLWKDDGSDKFRYHCVLFPLEACDKWHPYTTMSSAMIYRKELTSPAPRTEELATRRAIQDAAKVGRDAATAPGPSPEEAASAAARYELVAQASKCVGTAVKMYIPKADVEKSMMWQPKLCQEMCAELEECRFVVWVHNSQAASGCALFSSCEATEAHGTLTTTFIFSKTIEDSPSSVFYEFAAADIWCQQGEIPSGQWEGDEPIGPLTNKMSCQAECDSTELCKYFMYKDDPDSKYGRYRCGLFSACIDPYSYEDGDRSILFKKNSGLGPVYYDDFVKGHDCAVTPLAEALSNVGDEASATGLVTGRRVCEAGCNRDDRCRFYAWREPSNLAGARCALFPACPSTRAIPGGEASMVRRKRHGRPGGPYGGIEMLPWEDVEKFTNLAMASMTDNQKRSVMNGVGWDAWKNQHGFYIGNSPGVPHLGLPPFKMQDSGNGFRDSFSDMAGKATTFPSPLAVASSWDEELMAKQAVALGLEFIGKGANGILGPAVNVHRVAKGGRNFEYLSGEDPYLGARLARKYVEAIQAQGVMTVMKHFAFNEQETRRGDENSIVDDDTAWELYYPPFEACIEAGTMSAMCSYNKVNGTYACSNSNLLTRDLKGKMQFKGFVMSDWWAVHAHSAGAGLDMDQPGSTDHWFSQGDLSKYNTHAEITMAAMRIVLATYRLRLNEYPDCTPPQCAERMATDVTNPIHSQLAEDAAASSVVLLKNDGVLPLEVSRNVKRIAVVGWAAAALPSEYGAVAYKNPMPRGDYYSGGGSGHMYTSARRVVTALEGITRRARDANIEVIASASDDVEAAASVAQHADVVIVVAGSTTEENKDRDTLGSDGRVDGLIYHVAKIKPTIVLMEASGATLTPWRDDVSAAAILFMGGEATGTAWGRILFGDLSPEGKLPIMLPATASDTIDPTDRGEQGPQPSQEAWQCHHLNPDFGESLQWCATVGVYNGMQYHFVQKTTLYPVQNLCGCQCCKRPVETAFIDELATLERTEANLRAQAIEAARLAQVEAANGQARARVLEHEDKAIHQPPLVDQDAVLYKERMFTSYRSTTLKAAFAFGHGLSYTTFEYRDATANINGGGLAGGGFGLFAAAECSQAFACARVTVINKGDWPGREIAQVYAEFPDVGIARPRLQLRGFQKTRVLKPGESQEVTFAFSQRDLSVHNVEAVSQWEVQRNVRLHIGASSADIRHVVNLA